MVLAKGSIVSIRGIGEGVLSEEVNINLSTTFKSMFGDLTSQLADVSSMVTTVGTLSRSLTGFGFSGQTKQMTTQMWDKTDPASFNLNIEFNRVQHSSDNKQVSAKNMMGTVKRFCKIPLPGELPGGLLQPPGPSLIEGIGLDQLFSKITSIEDTRSADQMGLVDVRVGAMLFRRLLMQKAEPTFSKFVDESGYPISCRVAFTFVSIWAATKSMVDMW